MKLQRVELDALCEYVDGCRAAGERYDVIAGRLGSYVASGKLTEEELDGIEELHRGWKQRERFRAQRRAVGRDVEGGVCMVQEVGGLDVDGVLEVEAECREVFLERREEALRVLDYLRPGIRGLRGKWRYLETVSLPEGCEARRVKDPGEHEGVAWLMCAVQLVQGERIVRVYPECRVRGRREAGWNGLVRPSLELERWEVEQGAIDLRDIAARLAVLLQVTLGSERTGYKSMAQLAEALGVTREAVRVRRKKIMEEAGLRSAEGLVPQRGKGGRMGSAARWRKEEGNRSRSEAETAAGKGAEGAAVA